MPTALELTIGERRRYANALRERAVTLGTDPAASRLREELIARVEAAVASARARYRLGRVVLFGSVAHSDWFAPDTDVDLAVEGLDGETYWAVWRFLEELLPDRAVDLVDLRAVADPVRRAIERYGREV